MCTQPYLDLLSWPSPFSGRQPADGSAASDCALGFAFGGSSASSTSMPPPPPRQRRPQPAPVPAPVALDDEDSGAACTQPYLPDAPRQVVVQPERPVPVAAPRGSQLGSALVVAGFDDSAPATQPYSSSGDAPLARQDTKDYGLSGVTSEALVPATSGVLNYVFRGQSVLSVGEGDSDDDASRGGSLVAAVRPRVLAAAPKWAPRPAETPRGRGRGRASSAGTAATPPRRARPPGAAKRGAQLAATTPPGPGRQRRSSAASATKAPAAKRHRAPAACTAGAAEAAKGGPAAGAPIGSSGCERRRLTGKQAPPAPFR